jgi:hypothetical protein
LIRVKILGSGPKRTEARVSESGAVSVVERPFPPFGVQQNVRPFREFMTDDGTATGSSDMLVDGSVTPVPFFIQAPQDEDLYIIRLSFIIVDLNMVLGEFGNIGALTNGMRLFYTDERGEVTIADPLQTNFDFIRLCSGLPSFGDGTGAFIANNVVGVSEGAIPILDLKDTFGFRWGLELRNGSRQKLELTIRDDITGIDAMNVIAYGFTRLPEMVGEAGIV